MEILRLIIPAAACFSILWQTSCSESTTSTLTSGLSDYYVRGAVTKLDFNKSLASVKVLGFGRGLSEKLSLNSKSAYDFHIQPGDLKLLDKKKVFRATAHEIYSSDLGKIFSLSGVWPDEKSERIRVNNVNRLLRRDTLSMGEDMIRMVGDFVPPFALYDQNGQVVTTDYFDGSITVVNFIFTRCSVAEMCPASTLKMKNLQELAAKTKIPYVKFLSITLDPQYDSPGVLKSYALGYNLNENNFKLGTAPKSVINDLTRQFGIYRKNEKNQPLDHTMRTMIVNQRRQIVYQVPGKGWSVEDFLSRLTSGTM